MADGNSFRADGRRVGVRDVVGPNPERREEGADARRDDVEGPVVFVELRACGSYEVSVGGAARVARVWSAALLGGRAVWGLARGRRGPPTTTGARFDERGE